MWLSCCERGRGEYAERGARSVVVVVAVPVGDDGLCFVGAVELFNGEVSIAEPRIEQLGPCVLPGRARIDEVRSRTGRLAPVGERVRGEFWAVVAAVELRCTATVGHALLERRHGSVCSVGSVHDDGDGRPTPRAVPVRPLPDAIPSVISSRSYNDRRTPGINTLQLADHHQASNKLSVAMTD